MKDLRFFKDATEIGRLRVDSIQGEGNLTVMETYLLNDRSPDFDEGDPNIQLKAELAQNFGKIPKTFGDCIEFATDNSLTLLNVESNGDSSESLVGGIEITTASPLPGGNQSVAYSETIAVDGGSQDFTFAVTAGTLPSQLTLNSSTGEISGTPDTIEVQTFTVTVTDNVFGFTDEKEFELTIAA